MMEAYLIGVEKYWIVPIQKPLEAQAITDNIPLATDSDPITLFIGFNEEDVGVLGIEGAKDRVPQDKWAADEV